MPTSASVDLVRAPVRAQRAQEGVRGLDVEQAGLQRDQHACRRCAAPRRAACRAARPACRAPRAWCPWAGARSSSWLDLPAAGWAAAAAGRSASHCRDDCWRSTSPSITACPGAASAARHVGGQRALADPALGVGDHDHRHALSPLRRVRVMVAARCRALHRANPSAAPAPLAAAHAACRRSSSWSPTRSRSTRASTGALMRAAAGSCAPQRVRGARPVRAVPRLPDRRGGRAGRCWPMRAWWSGSIRSTGTACRR